MKKRLEHLLAIEYIVLSGSIIIGMQYAGISKFIFILTSILFFITSYKDDCWRKNFNYNLKTLLLLCSWVLVNCILINPSEIHSFINFIAYPTFAFLTIPFMSFKRFRNLLLKYLNILSLISIIVQLLHNKHVLPAYPVVIDSLRYDVSLYFFNTGWGGNRLSSIYWEPGQYQIVIFYVLCLFTDELIKLHHWRSIIKRFGVLFIALTMTYSTTGYISFITLFAGVLLYSKIKTFNKVVLLFPIGIIAIYNIIYSSTIQDKMITSHVSYNTRINDNIACLNISIENPIFGLGINTENIRRKFLLYDNQTSSNGWLYTSASLGFPYIIIIFILMYKNIKRMKPGIHPVFIFLVLLISQCNEFRIVFPYLWMYIFRYRKYGQYKRSDFQTIKMQPTANF